MRVLIVDDHLMFRDGLISVLGSHPDFQVVGEAGSVREAVEKARLLKPELVLMDFSLPDGTGLEATQAILVDFPDCKIVLLTIHDENEILFEAIRAGARGYVHKRVSISSLIASLKIVGKGELAFPRSMSTQLLQELAMGGMNKMGNPVLAKLSCRERGSYVKLP